MGWRRLPFRARNRAEFSQGLNNWLGDVFYDLLPAQGFEVREEQIYTTFQIAKALINGGTLFAEAGSGTGKTFAYLLPALAYARFMGKPVIIATSSSVLQRQLTQPGGDIETLSKLLDLQIEARVAADPGDYLCEVKLFQTNEKALSDWGLVTKTGLRSEVPEISDALWAEVNWDPSLPCDACPHRGTCHPMAARRQVRTATDLIVTDHTLLTDALLGEDGPRLLPPYAAIIADEGHHLPDVWARGQGYQISAERLSSTLAWVSAYAEGPGALAAARWQSRVGLAQGLVPLIRSASRRFSAAVAQSQGEGRRELSPALFEAAEALSAALRSLQDELAVEEAMSEATEAEVNLAIHQARLEQLVAALRLLRSEAVVTWAEGDDVWVVPKRPAPLVAGVPLIFSSATLAPAYAAEVLGLAKVQAVSAGTPFDLASQVLIYRPAEPDLLALLTASGGRALILLPTLAEVQKLRYKLRWPFPLLVEGDQEQGAMLAAFRADVSSILLGANLWEGVDVPGEALSLVVIPRLPFPPHDPLIVERRRQAQERGEDPFMAVDLPLMLLKLKQGAGRLIRSVADRGVLAILDRSWVDEPWAEQVFAALPAGAPVTESLDDVKKALA